MSLDAHFNAAAAMLVKTYGAAAVYTQDASPQTFNVYVDRNFEVIDEQSGAGQIVKAALIAKDEFPFSSYKVGDTIAQDGTTYTVTRKLTDDGIVITLELK